FFDGLHDAIRPEENKSQPIQAVSVPDECPDAIYNFVNETFDYDHPKTVSIANDIWNACRAAMLAKPVSSQDFDLWFSQRFPMPVSDKNRALVYVGWHGRGEVLANQEPTETLEELIRKHRISIMSEYESGWSAAVYGDDSSPIYYGGGMTPLEAVRDALANGDKGMK
ncbi:hypothetical protein, partial [Martelella alba]|uniref:hypothetical protein n=1 Tax=Martelella alba TaxID=2590451 RepID=UPI001E338AD5